MVESKCKRGYTFGEGEELKRCRDIQNLSGEHSWTRPARLEEHWMNKIHMILK